MEKSGHEPTVCSCSPGGQLYPGLHEKRCGQYDEETLTSKNILFLRFR